MLSASGESSQSTAGRGGAPLKLKLQPILPNSASSSCNAEGLCQAATALSRAGDSMVNDWLSMLGPEERSTVTALYNLVAESSLGEVDGAGSLKLGASLEAANAPPGIGEALGEAVTQVLEGVDAQLNSTRQSLIQALDDLETSISSRVQALEINMKKASLKVPAGTRLSFDNASGTTRSSPAPSPTPTLEAIAAIEPKSPGVEKKRRKSCMKKGSTSSISSTDMAGAVAALEGGDADIYGRMKTDTFTNWAECAQKLGNHFQDSPTIHYEVAGYKLGQGTFGTTRIGKHREGRQERAIKSVPKALMIAQAVDIWQEVHIMYGLDHPNIVRLFSTYEDTKQTYLVMELCSGGELFDAIVDNTAGLTETNAARLMRQMLAAVVYLHAHKICHRDLKPENFLLSRKVEDESKVVKLIDFGSAKSYLNGAELTTKVFTVHYVAPEILTRKTIPYTEVCDVWSLGVILFLLLAGRPPFGGEDDMAIMKAIKKGRYVMAPESVWSNVSSDAVELMTGMLEVQPLKRHSAQTAYRHGWIEQLAPHAHGTTLANQEVCGALRSFMAQNKLKKFALQAIAQNVSDEHIDSLKAVFLAFDTDHQGFLHMGMIEDAIKSLHLEENTERDLKHVLEEMAKAGNGMVNYTQFLGATIDRKHYMQETALREVFNCFDVDGDGSISKEELASLLAQDKQSSADAHELDAILEKVDKDGDGNIDFQEFMDMMSDSRHL